MNGKSNILVIQKGKIIIIVAAVTVVLSVTLILAFSRNIARPTPSASLLPSINTQIDPNATNGAIGDDAKEIVEKLNKQVADGMINITINTAPVFESKESAGNLQIENKPINKYSQIIVIYRDDTNEMIYQSGLIPVGSRIESAKLSKPIDEGTYPCTAYFQSVDANGNPLGKAGAKIIITIGTHKAS